MKKQLIVRYDGFHEEMEDELRLLLKRYGWCWRASGRNLETGIRDIAYEREEPNKGSVSALGR